MEKIYPAGNYDCTDNEPLKEYFESFAKLCENDKFQTAEIKDEDIFKIMDLDLSEDSKLELLDTFSIDKLTVPNELSLAVPKNDFGPYQTLYDINLPKEAKSLNIVKYSEKRKKRSKLHNVPPVPIENPDDYEITPPKDKLTMGSEFIIHVKVHLPKSWSGPEASHYRYQHLVKSHEIAILGSQTITQLRDKIQCTNDFGFTIESKDCEELNIDPDPNVKKEYPSGFIYVDGVFYNDMRAGNSVDYSEVLRKWAKGKKDIGPLTTADMHKTLISDLTPRLNYPYVYQHRGDCEHVLIFDRARLLTHADLKHPLSFPHIVHVHRTKTALCHLCLYSVATRFVTDADRSPHNVTYYCHHCYVSYNYIDGERVGKFTAYPFYDRSLLF